MQKQYRDGVSKNMWIRQADGTIFQMDKAGHPLTILKSSFRRIISCYPCTSSPTGTWMGAVVESVGPPNLA